MPSAKNPLAPYRLTIGALCRLDQTLIERIVARQHLWAIAGQAALLTFLGTFTYGFTFGLWRGALQGLFSALKLPLLLFSIVLLTTVANGVVAVLLKTKITLLQGLVVVLLSLAIGAVLLGALAPVSLLLVLSVPSPLGMPATEVIGSLQTLGKAELQRTAELVLLLHIVVIGCCGIAGNMQLHRLLFLLTGSKRTATRMLTFWLLVDAFIGTQLSWIMRPFLCKPHLPIQLFRSDALDGNFFEEIFRILAPLWL